MTTTTRWLAGGLATLLALLSLLPLGSLGLRWLEYRRDVGLPLLATPVLGYDGVRWEDAGGEVRAAYVVPRSTAARSGIETGDRLRALDVGPVGTVAEAEMQIQRATGTVLTYSLDRNGQQLDREVWIHRYPTFLYPLSAPLWVTSIWAFAVVAFLHLLAYLTVAPLAVRSARARRARRLIGAALVWVGVNLMRLAWVSALGAPPGGQSLQGAVFDGLTLIALCGWIAYPALLLDQSLRTRAALVALGRQRVVLAVPPVVLGGGVVLATVLGHLGPLPPDAFAVPILFYVCVYVGVATGLAVVRPSAGREAASRLSRLGSLAVVALAVVGAGVALAQLGPGTREAQVTSAWFVVGFQLFSLLPVALVSLATLRHGPFDALLVRSLATLTTVSVAFTVIVLGGTLLDAVLPGGSQPLALGMLVVLVLLVAERLAPALRERVQLTFQTERQRARQRLDRFGDEIRSTLDVGRLAQGAADAIGEALGARTAVVFLQAGQEPEARWVRAPYRPESPTFTQAELGRVWDRLRDEGRVWSRNEELNESALPRVMAERLARLDAAVAVPVTTGRGRPVGLLVLGRKARRLSVYNTEDVDRLRAVAAQLAVAVERLALLEREREMVRQTAQAEMAALRAQINPHFLFNALNTVAALIRDRPDEAESTVEHLAGLFRDVLTASGQASVALRDEMRLVRRYLHVEQARFGEALAVDVDVADDVAGVPVPAFAVQTLVENAVKHGVERKRGGGSVTVRARGAAGALEVVVEDTGVGLVPGTPYGVGLQNVADRLHLLYGDRSTLDVQRTGTGTSAVLRLPIEAP